MLKIYFIIGVIVALINCIMYIICQKIDEDSDSTWHKIEDGIRILRDPISTSERKKYARRNIVILSSIVLVMSFIVVPIVWPIILIGNAILIIRLFIKND